MTQGEPRANRRQSREQNHKNSSKDESGRVLGGQEKLTSTSNNVQIQESKVEAQETPGEEQVETQCDAASEIRGVGQEGTGSSRYAGPLQGKLLCSGTRESLGTRTPGKKNHK